MNEDLFRSRLQEAYRVTIPADLAATRRRARSRFLAPTALAVAGLAAITGFYGPVQANLYCREVVQRLRNSSGYIVSIEMKIDPEPLGTRSHPGEVACLRDESTDWRPGCSRPFFFDRGDDYRQYNPVTHTYEVLKASEMDWGSRLLDSLSEIDFHKIAAPVGVLQEDGRTVERTTVRMTEKTSDNKSYPCVATIDLDKASGDPYRISLRAPFEFGSGMKSFGPEMTISATYRFDSDEVTQRLRGPNLSGYRRFDPDKFSLGQPTALAHHKFGRDNLTIYKVDENARGNIFVLYACDGYHRGRMGDGLRLSDEHGQEWLSSPVSMEFVRWKVGGLMPMAQVFFAPDRPRTAKRVTLWTRLIDGWEFSVNQIDGRLTPTGYAVEPFETGGIPTKIGVLNPTTVDTCPDWFLTAFAGPGEAYAQFQGEAAYARAKFSAAKGSYEAASGYAREALASIASGTLPDAEGDAAAILYLAGMKTKNREMRAEARPVLQRAIRENSFSYWKDPSIVAGWLGKSQKG